MEAEGRERLRERVGHEAYKLIYMCVRVFEISHSFVEPGLWINVLSYFIHISYITLISSTLSTDFAIM